MYRKIQAWLVFLALLAGASSLSAQIHMHALQEFEPTAFYETIYSMMEQCTDVLGDYEAVRWYTSSAIASPSTDRAYWGIWFESWGWPSIVLDREKAFDGVVVSHEIMHDLYGGQGPMDKYSQCVLDWDNLQTIIQIDTDQEDTDDERSRSSTKASGSDSAVRPEGRSGT